MRIFAVITLLLSSSPAFAQSVADRAMRDELVFMQDEEPAMRRAFSKANETLDDFLSKARAASAEHTGFSLKVAISQGKNTEYFWVNDFKQLSDGSFEGEIGNEPRMVKTVKLGQRYGFPRTKIVDWTYIDKAQRKMVGNFTFCALLTKEPAGEAEATRKRFKLDCDWLR